MLLLPLPREEEKNIRRLAGFEAACLLLLSMSVQVSPFLCVTRREDSN